MDIRSLSPGLALPYCVTTGRVFPTQDLSVLLPCRGPQKFGKAGDRVRILSKAFVPDHAMGFQRGVRF